MSDSNQSTSWTPLIIAADFIPNPAVAGEKVLLRIVAIDVFGEAQPQIFMADEIMSGEG